MAAGNLTSHSFQIRSLPNSEVHRQKVAIHLGFAREALEGPSDKTTPPALRETPCAPREGRDEWLRYEVGEGFLRKSDSLASAPGEGSPANFLFFSFFSFFLFFLSSLFFPFFSSCSFLSFPCFLLFRFFLIFLTFCLSVAFLTLFLFSSSSFFLIFSSHSFLFFFLSFPPFFLSFLPSRSLSFLS